MYVHVYALLTVYHMRGGGGVGCGESSSAQNCCYPCVNVCQNCLG